MTSAAVRLLTGLSFAIMMPLLTDAQVSNDLVKIGVLTDLSGPGSTPTGQGSVVAAQYLVLVQAKKPEESRYPWDYYQILAQISGCLRIA